MDKAKLVERRDNLVRNREQLVANVNMLQGMIEEVNFWIKSEEAEEAEEEALEDAADTELETEFAKDDADAKWDTATADTEEEVDGRDVAPNDPEGDNVGRT